MKTETKKEMHELQIFDFKDHDVRTLLINNEPWFVATDVCKILDIKNPSQAMQRLDKDDLSKTYVLDTRGCKQNSYVINEAGLYTLILRSNKPQALEFQHWITHDVLPSIRKTGGYSESGTAHNGGFTDADRQLLTTSIHTMGQVVALLINQHADSKATTVAAEDLRPRVEFLTVTELGKRCPLKLSPEEVNILLTKRGLQTKHKLVDGNTGYHPTNKAMGCCRVSENRRTSRVKGGGRVNRIVWADDVLDK